VPLALAKLPERIRGYGHVKLANVATARAQQQDLLQRFAAGEAPTPGPAERKVIAIKAS
jgi:indolepyruvate ferredoxin oxidoreductase